MTKRILPHKDNWLAAEYALGVLDSKDMVKAEAKYNNEITFRHTVDDWHSQFEPFLNEVDEVMPSKAVWQNIDKTLYGSANQGAKPASIWKFMTALSSTVAVAALGALMFITGGDFTGHQIKTLEQELASAQTTIENVNEQVATTKTQLLENNTRLTETEAAVAETTEQLAVAESKLAEVNDKLTSTENELSNTTGQLASTQNALTEANNQFAASQDELSQTKTELAATTDNANSTRSELASAKDELLETRNQLASAQSEVSEIRRSIQESTPLIASLTQSGDAPSFVAQFDPLKGALLILTALEDDTERVPEVWLIPSGGPREGDVISLGVMNEEKPEEIKLGDDFKPLITEGGTLAITMEPPGGAPNGVATGPIIALGKLQALR